MLIALVGLNANAAMYIVGSDPFGNWNPGNGVEMTDNGDGTYSYTVAINGTVYFVFGDGLNSDWGIFNANYRYGPATGDTGISAGNWVTTQKAGDHGAYFFTGSGDDYVFTFDEINSQFKVEGYVEPFNPLTGELFILGQVNGNNWNPSTGVEMNTTDEITFTLSDAEISDSGDGYGYFSFTTKLGENADDWGFLPYRRGALADGTLVEDNTETALGAWGTANAFKALPGTYDITVSINDQNAYVKIVKKADPQPVVDDVFIMGEVNGNAWAANVGVKMNLNEGVYTANITTTGENDGKSYFSFTKQLAEGAEDWDAIAPYRFGAVSEGDFVMTEELLGAPCDLATDGSSNAIAIPAGEWTVTVDLVSNKFTIDGTWPVDTVIPEPEADVYIMGEVNGNGWAANVGVKMTLNEGVYTANITTTGENNGKSYFSFTKMLAEGNEEADWNAIAPYRFGAASEGDFWMAEELLGVQCDLATDGSYNAIAIPAGEWTVTVDLVSNKFTIDGTWPAIEPEHYDGDVYILGDVNDNGGWFTNKGVKMTRDAENNVYTATITTTGEAYFNPETNTGYSYFSFTKQLAEGADDWNAIAPYRFGAVSEGDFWVTDETLGVDINLANNGSTFQIPAGEWNFTLSVDNMTLVINKVEFPRGDVDKSGDVKIADVTALINYLLSGDASLVDLQAADCDKSGDVKIGDVTVLINYLLSGVWPE